MKNTTDKIIERSDVVPIVRRSTYLHGNRIYIGDVMVKLREIESESVQ